MSNRIYVKPVADLWPNKNWSIIKPVAEEANRYQESEGMWNKKLKSLTIGKKIYKTKISWQGYLLLDLTWYHSTPNNWNIDFKKW